MNNSVITEAQAVIDQLQDDVTRAYDGAVTVNQEILSDAVQCIKSLISLTMQSNGTPGSRWAAEGQPDPHGDTYNCERAELILGHLSDDELANEAFLNYDRRPDFQDVIDGKAHMPIAYMTAVKERIRWLSRKLSEQASQPQWIPVSERLPKTDTAILVFHEGEVKKAWFDGYQHAVGDNHVEESENSPTYRGFTHWMLQPEPPKSA